MTAAPFAAKPKITSANGPEWVRVAEGGVVMDANYSIRA